MKLYYYCNLRKQEQRGWFANLGKFRTHFHKVILPSDAIIRCAHVGIEPPKGFHKPNGELACDAIERIPTMRDLIHAMTGR